jgi:hypothetical protein
MQSFSDHNSITSLEKCRCAHMHQMEWEQGVPAAVPAIFVIHCKIRSRISNISSICVSTKKVSPLAELFSLLMLPAHCRSMKRVLHTIHAGK